MHWLKCSLLAAVILGINWKESAAQTQPVETTEALHQASTQNVIEVDGHNSTEISSSTSGATVTGKPGETGNVTETAATVKSQEKRHTMNVTLKDVKPFFLFPILPLLFPKENDEGLTGPKNGELSKGKNDSQLEGAPNEGKPFVLFDFAFNIRRIPISNITSPANDSKIINVKKLTVRKDSDNSKKAFSKRRRRNAKKHKSGVFDYLPLFQDSEFDEFFPKPDLFFPDLPFAHKPMKKLSRRKRDMKKKAVKNDLKFFMDAVDEAFMRTKKELQHTDPILNFLNGGDASSDGDKKGTDDFFSDFLDPKPNLWEMPDDVKKLSHEPDPLAKNQDSPMIIVDKVVRIGEFQVHDQNHDTAIKRGANYPKKLTGGDKGLDDKLTLKFLQEADPLEITDESKSKEGSHRLVLDGGMPAFTKVESKEIRVFPQVNASFLTVRANATVELQKRDAGNATATLASTAKPSKGLLKMIESMKPAVERLKRKATGYYDKMNSKALSYEDLKKNISDVLNQFLSLVRKLDVNDGGETESFDWTEKETLQKNSRKRQKKQTNFEDEYADEVEKNQRQVADLNYLFLTVTLPTLCIFALLLLVCFFNLNVKGRICTSLFKPRQVFLVGDETSAQSYSKAPTRAKKTAAI